MDAHKEVSTVFSRAPAGLEAPMIRVEVRLDALDRADCLTGSYLFCDSM
jgi:hypothetical protein